MLYPSDSEATVLNTNRFPRHGNMRNSPFFEDVLPRLLEERDRVGLTDMIGGIEALLITVEPGNAVQYIAELALMTPYHYLYTLDSPQHFTHVLRIDLDAPDILLREVKSSDYQDIFRNLNDLYPAGAQRPHSRYLGEILHSVAGEEVMAIQKAREFRFFSQEAVAALELPVNLCVGKPSPYTQNIVAYLTRAPGADRVYALGEKRLQAAAQMVSDQSKALQAALRVDDLIQPVDHLATRVYSQNREVAILEYLGLSSYYYWGSYEIPEQNSSTNVCKSARGLAERRSPAKVFTANKLPYCVNHLARLESPTENFVRNYGPRLHHIALAVRDGERDGREHIDFVVDAMARQGKRFLLDVTGSRDKGLKQIFSSASPFSALIIEYVQRYDGFDGFFTQDNVAHLTRAAGREEELVAALQASSR